MPAAKRQPKLPADYIQLRPAASLKANPRNSRTHGPAQLAEIEASMAEFGFTNPVLAEGDSIVAGHGRLTAALAIYARGETIALPGGRGALPKGMVPVIDATGWSEAQIRAYIIADNRIAENAEWDKAMLIEELSFLDNLEGFDVGLTGFDSDDLAALIAGEVEQPPAGPGLAARFGVAPFSVLNARDGWWQDRKRAWLALGIQSELGRGETGGHPIPGGGGSGHDSAWGSNGQVGNEGSKYAKPRRKANAVPGGAPPCPSIG